MWQQATAHCSPSPIIMSSRTPSPMRYPVRALRRRYGALVMLSMPPARTTSKSPARMSDSAKVSARIPEPQTRLIVSAGTSTPMPARRATWRAGFCPAPPCSTWPKIVLSTSAADMPARSIAARAATVPRSTAVCVASAPPSLPNGVRAPPRITARRDGSDIIPRLLEMCRGPRAPGNR